MDKKILTSIIERYYLGGLTEQVRWKINNNNLKINFATTLKDCIGELNAPVNLQDNELGIYDTTQLYKLVKICNDPIEIDIVEKDGKAMKMEIKDNQFDLSYNLGDLGLISEASLSNTLPEPSIELILDQDFISRFIKAHNALEKIETFSIQPKVDKQKVNTLEFVIGLQERYANKITFSQPTEIYNDLPKFVFKVPNFREILNNNTNSSIKMLVYPMGIISLITKEDELKCQYWLVPNK